MHYWVGYMPENKQRHTPTEQVVSWKFKKTYLVVKKNQIKINKFSLFLEGYRASISVHRQQSRLPSGSGADWITLRKVRVLLEIRSNKDT